MEIYAKKAPSSSYVRDSRDIDRDRNRNYDDDGRCGGSNGSSQPDWKGIKDAYDRSKQDWGPHGR